MGLEIHPNRGRKVAKKLFNDFHHGDGILGHNDMPEDVIPESIRESSLEHLLFITLTTSIDYMRNADSLWESSRNTYEDPSTQYLFDPESLQKTPNKKIQRDMQKYGLAKKNKQDPWI